MGHPHRASVSAPMGVAFHFPYIAGGQYTIGHQVFQPGEPNANWPGFEGMQFSAQPWPGQVPYLPVLTNQVYFPTDRPIAPTPSGRYATALEDSLFMAGFVGKSKG